MPPLVSLVISMLLGLITAPVSSSRLDAELLAGLPICAGGAQSTTAPAGPPRPTDPLCRAVPTIAWKAHAPEPAPGYHHLGATSAGEWSGVRGRIQVRDPAVRAGTFDFVATRFMVKQDVGDTTIWLEAGWSENGWLRDGRQHIYTFDTNQRQWRFYDQYRVTDGARIWIYLETGESATRSTWHAWLWWGDRWNLLSSQVLPVGRAAYLEQFVEVYVDPAKGGTVGVPRIAVDNVQVKTAPAGELRYWRGDVATDPGAGIGSYCVGWEQPYDTWWAGTCPVE